MRVAIPPVSRDGVEEGIAAAAERGVVTAAERVTGDGGGVVEVEVGVHAGVQS
jgi:hypothetical protein